MRRLLTVLLINVLLLSSCAVDQNLGKATPSDGPDENSIGQNNSNTGEPVYTYAGTEKAPDAPQGLDWFNVDRPLSLSGDLRGKIILLDFWTQGCINCIHVVPELAQLEKEFEESLVVIGVHWAKFDHERSSSAVKQAIARYGVDHPVVNDDYEYLRQSYRIKAWPSTVLIDPLGKVVGVHSGEGVYDLFQPVIETMSLEYGAAGLLNTRPINEIAGKPALLTSVLQYPGKVLADKKRDRLYIADSGHNRILIADLKGKLLESVGSGAAGFLDGSFDDAQFSRPQGMEISADGRKLYVADRENHSIRAIDLESKLVSTIAGTGEPTNRFTSGFGVQTALASPWDLLAIEDRLFIAGAGRHQIWDLELESGWLSLFAGSGREGIEDGARLLATLAQPSALTSDGQNIYFADSESSAVRKIGLGKEGNVETLVGTGLFAWGDEIGDLDMTQLQHPVGLELLGDTIYVADTYNHRIKSINLTNGESRYVAGSGKPGLMDGYGTISEMNEPSGLSAAGKLLYIADTNNHLIRKLDTVTGKLDTLSLSNLDVAQLKNIGIADDYIELSERQVRPGKLKIIVDYSLPEGYKFNTGGTFRFELTVEKGSKFAIDGLNIYEANGPKFPLEFFVEVPEVGTSVLRAESTVFYCPIEEESFCLLRDVEFKIPIVATENISVNEIRLQHALPSAEKLEKIPSRR
jgi:DNA-binding beta-propeller fold protein YncE|tara:strand:- start:1930 stop:4008 length:2079 start_codon:yes stop_codon:yes gene_type:complete